MAQKRDTTLVLSTLEFLYLLKTEGSHLFLMPEDAGKAPTATEPDLKKGRERLIERALLERDGKISLRYKALLAPLFDPEKVLLLVRDIQDGGRQSVTYLRKGDAALVYCYLPAKDTYQIELIESIEQVTSLFSQWFQMGKYAPVSERHALSRQSLEDARRLVRQGDRRAALDILKEAGFSQQDCEQLADALHQPYLSGSLAALEFPAETATYAFSFAFLADHQTMWHMVEPAPELGLLIVDRNTDSLARILDQAIHRFFSDEKMDQPIEKDVVVTFSLTGDELAYCLMAVNAPADARHLLKMVHPNDPEEKMQEYLASAGIGLLARGWCRPSPAGSPVMEPRLEAAVFPLARFDFVVQAEITRPQVNASAAINVLQKRMFTALLHPDERTFVLEHGNIATLPAYVSRLFLDFGEGPKPAGRRKTTVRYGLLPAALEQDGEKRLARLKKAGFSEPLAVQFADDHTSAIYRGSIIRINADSKFGTEVAQKATKPTLLLLKSEKNSWVFEFSTEDADEGSASLVDRPMFKKILENFLQ